MHHFRPTKEIGTDTTTIDVLEDGEALGRAGLGGGPRRGAETDAVAGPRSTANVHIPSTSHVYRYMITPHQK